VCYRFHDELAAEAADSLLASEGPDVLPERRVLLRSPAVTPARDNSGVAPRERLSLPDGRLLLFAAGGVLLLLRLAALVGSVSNRVPLTGDEPIYDRVAHNLLAGLGYSYHDKPWLFKPPGWPVTLAGIYAVFGEGRRIVTLFQGLFDAGTIALAAWVAWRVFRSRATAVTAFLLVALWPPFFRESRFEQTEPLYTFGLALLLAAFVRFVQRPTSRAAFVVGVCAGLASLVRPNGIVPLFALTAGWLLVGHSSAQPHVRKLLAAALGLVLVLTPWTLRNAVVFHAFVPLSTGAGYLFYMGTAPETQGMWIHDPMSQLTAAIVEREGQRLGRPAGPLEGDRALLRAGLENWRSAPVRSLAISVKRFWRLCFVSFDSSDRVWLRWSFLAVLIALYALALPAGMAGMREGGRGWPLAGVLLLAVLGTAAASTVLLTNSRFFEPVRPLLLILAADPLARLFTRRPGAPLAG
jgi:4-amino-4-deoxy-L-arabinose transferase-like glycosyltransferase